VRWFAPSIVFTAEEAWKAIGNKSSIHLEEFIKVPSSFCNKKLANKWNFIKDVRKLITGALEIKRSEKIIGSSLQANVNLYVTSEKKEILKNIDIAEIGIVSSFSLNTSDIPSTAFKIDTIKDVGAEIDLAEGKKCARCWKILPEVLNEDICERCKDVISQ
tara:strand:- start:244 stop:726 length:483 start_codon:yes stop_codon:yes gene_type:complete